MSTYVVTPTRRVAAAGRRSLAGRSALLAIAGAGLAASVAGGVLVASSGHLLHPVLYGAEIATVVASTVAAALVWAVRRPGNALALALLAYAVAAVGVSLQGASDPLLHSVGVLCDAPMFILGYYLALAFPEGRLSRVLDGLLVAAIAAVLLLTFVPWFFFSPVVSGGAPLAGCNATCPSNALMIADRPSIAAGFGTTEEYFAVAIPAAIVLVLVYRLATVSRPRRRALVPVYVPVLLLAVPFTIFHAAAAGFLTLSATAAWRIGWFVTAGRIGLSFGFLLAIAQTTFFAGAALKRIVGRIGDSSSAADLRDVMADALDDPSLEVAFPAGEGEDAFLDSRGRAIEPGDTGASSVQLTRNGTTVAYIVHDPALDADPELLRAAGQALALALESGRLETEVVSMIDELRSSQARLVAARDEERRKLESDLHDGAQQRLIGMLAKIGVARMDLGADSELVRRLDEFGDELEELLGELRELGRGSYPPVLRDLGLERALAAAARRSVPPARFESEGLARYSEEVETAVYYSCVEALQNAGKHAGADARTNLRVWQDDSHIGFEVSDDGTGYDTAAVNGGGSGLANMRERVAALDGRISITSAPGRGTTVRGWVPTAGGAA